MMKGKGLYKIYYSCYVMWVCGDCLLDVAQKTECRAVDWKIKGKCDKCNTQTERID